MFDFSKNSSIFDFCQLYQNLCQMRSGKRTQWWVTASLKTIIVTHCRFNHCYYLPERKCPRNFIILIYFFERYGKLPFVSTQHHCLFINFGGGKERGSRQKIVKSKKYYKLKQPLPDHQTCFLFGIRKSGSYFTSHIPSTSTADVKSNDCKYNARRKHFWMRAIVHETLKFSMF